MVGALKNQIYVGSLENPVYYFENDQILSTPTTQRVALVGQELSIDTFSPVVMDDPGNLLNITRFRSSDGQELQTPIGQVFTVDAVEGGASDIINIPKGTPMWYKNRGELIGKFYILSVDRIGRNQFRLNGESAIGLLDHMYHGGGLWTASTFGEVLQHILAGGLHGAGSPVIPYEIDEEVSRIPVSGWLPYASKRNNLYQLIFAYGVNIVKNIDGNPRFTFVYSSNEAAQEIPDNRVFNVGSVEYTQPYSAVDVVEHTYTPITSGVDAAILFDNSTGAQVFGEEIWFDSAPVIVSTLTTQGSLSVISATENSAVLSGNGILLGVPYTHTTRIVTKNNPQGVNSQVVHVSECTLVNWVNSQNLLNRLYAFYCPPDYIQLIKNSVKYTNERCGKSYRIHTPYREEKVAFLSSMEINSTSFLRSNCEFYAGYDPAGQAGLYKHVVIITPTLDESTGEYIYTGTWQVPEDVTEFKAVLISGGTGGSSGYPGENGKDTSAYTEVEKTADLSAVWYGAEGGQGGQGGIGGDPGKVRVFTVEETTPGTIYSYNLGQGGQGGNSTGFIPDTEDELRAALQNEHPEKEYTSQEIHALLEQEEELTDWEGTPNVGQAGTASTFADGTNIWSTTDQESYSPTGGVYEPVTGEFYALPGDSGLAGGSGGARRIDSGTVFNWVTDGADVTDDTDTTYRGGLTGQMVNEVPKQPKINCKLYGGNGAGAAIGIDRDTHEKINGQNPPPKLIIQYQYQDSIVQTKHVQLLPAGYEYSIKNVYPQDRNKSRKQVFRPENLICTGTMGNKDTTVTESVQLALNFNSSNHILSIYSVDEATIKNNIVNISGQEYPVEVTLSGARSGRHNDPLYDTSYSYLPIAPQKQSVYGSGGRGGHGGGGGAGASTVIIHELGDDMWNKLLVKTILQSHGYGSGGGQGGQGGDGCILIYY